MARRRAMDREQLDDYTPATDLVFSMFAMTVLLLAIFGAGDHVKENAQQGQVLVFQAQLDRMAQDRQALEARLAAQASGPAPSPSPIPPPDELQASDPRPAIGPATAPDDGAARLAALQDDLAQARARALEAEARLRRRADLEMAQARLGEVSEGADGPFMLPQQAAFAPASLARLIGILRAGRGQVEAIRANRLLFELSTAAQRGRADDGTDLDLMETMVWAEALVRALRPTGLPPGCLAVLPAGKLRSSFLNRLAAGPKGAEAVSDFEDLLRLQRVPPAVRQEIEAARPWDRRITVWAQAVPGDICAPGSLLEALVKLP